MIEIVLGFGSNLGDRASLISEAYSMVEKSIGKLVKKSSIIETKPWGFDSEDLFLNSVACFLTNLSPIECLEEIHTIEKSLGRVRKNIKGYQSRTIDIDILFYGKEVINESNLVVPHPLIAFRDFVLIPLKEIIPEYEHPVLKQKIKDINLQN